MGRGVAAARVVLADGGGGLPLLAEQRVDERRLADARRAQHDRGVARVQVRRERVEAVAGQRGQDHDRDGRGDRLDREAAAVEVGRDVGLVEDDDRPDAARPGHREVALEPAQVEVAVEAGDEERHVDVGREDLLVGEVPADRRLASAALRTNADRRGRTAGMTPVRCPSATVTQSPTAG